METSECRGCDVCKFALPGVLYADVDGKHYCLRCWIKAGRPWPRRVCDPVEAASAAIAARERMLKRGGTDRYRARAGKA